MVGWQWGWLRKANRGKSPAESRFLCLPVSPDPGDMWLHNFTGRGSQTQPSAPSDIFPLRQIKEEGEDPPGGRVEMGGRTGTDKAKKASEREERESQRKDREGHRWWMRSEAGRERDERVWCNWQKRRGERKRNNVWWSSICGWRLSCNLSFYLTQCGLSCRSLFFRE